MTTNHWGIPGSPIEIYQNSFIPDMIGEWVPRVLALGNLNLAKKRWM